MLADGLSGPALSRRGRGVLRPRRKLRIGDVVCGTIANFYFSDGYRHGFRTLWEDRQWGIFNISLEQAKLGFPFVDENRLLIDERAQQYFYLTYLPVTLGGSTFYFGGLRDKDGETLNGTDTYKLRVSADTPAEDFWSAIVYSMKTKGFVKDVDRVGLSSQVIDTMQKNKDGSVDVYFAPKAPEGMVSNWIPTGEDFFLLFRLYGPKEGWLQSGWKLGDIEKVN